MKVAFLGSHGTGKTTLCYQLAAHLKKLDRHVDLVKEVARRCPLPLNRETTLDAQRWILHTQIASEISAVRDHDAVVCDRAVLDNYAYLVQRVGRIPALDALVSEWMKTYDTLFKVPVLMLPRFDGVRDTAPEFQGRIDTIIDTLIDEFDIDCHRLSETEPDAWLAEILNALALPLEPPQISLFRSEQDVSGLDRGE